MMAHALVARGIENSNPLESTTSENWVRFRSRFGNLYTDENKVIRSHTS